jgi:hypothetical protein
METFLMAVICLFVGIVATARAANFKDRKRGISTALLRTAYALIAIVGYSASLYLFFQMVK